VLTFSWNGQVKVKAWVSQLVPGNPVNHQFFSTISIATLGNDLKKRE
jgi:hypothetical protein